VDVGFLTVFVPLQLNQDTCSTGPGARPHARRDKAMFSSPDQDECESEAAATLVRLKKKIAFHDIWEVSENHCWSVIKRTVVPYSVDIPAEVQLVWSKVHDATTRPVMKVFNEWIESLPRKRREKTRLHSLLARETIVECSNFFEDIPTQTTLDLEMVGGPSHMRMTYMGALYEAQILYQDSHVGVAMTKITNVAEGMPLFGRTKFLASTEAILLSVCRATYYKNTFDEVVRYIQDLWVQPSREVIALCQDFLIDHNYIKETQQSTQKS